MATAIQPAAMKADLNGTSESHSAHDSGCSQDLVSAQCSPLQAQLLNKQPHLPDILRGSAAVQNEQIQSQVAVQQPEIAQAFPKLTGRGKATLVAAQTPARHNAPIRAGVVLSGGQASGGHNVIAGLWDSLQKHAAGSVLYGFLNGPHGIVSDQYIQLDSSTVDKYRNQGGFHMIGSGRGKIESQDDLRKAADAVKALQLNGLVVIGGDDSNTNAAVLAEHFLQNDVQTCVVGVPKTIGGDLKNADIATSFGFDTASKVFSELIGNIMLDALSAKKYYHIIRLMGRDASHLTLECALQTRPQAALISEEVHAHGTSLSAIIKQLADIVQQRSTTGRNYGVFLIPEGLIEYVPEMHTLITELNDLLAQSSSAHLLPGVVATQLTPKSQQVFELLPPATQLSLLLERDPHGNVQVARIETEKVILEMLERELASRKTDAHYMGTFNGLTHYFGYEGRCSMPSNFDAACPGCLAHPSSSPSPKPTSSLLMPCLVSSPQLQPPHTCPHLTQSSHDSWPTGSTKSLRYCNALGHCAGALIQGGQTGVMATIHSLQRPVREWGAGGTPLVGMMCLERRKGKLKAVIKKALVQLEGAPYQALVTHRATWAQQDCYRSPGPIQFEGACANFANLTLALERNQSHSISLI